MTTKEEKDEVIKDYTQEKLLAYDKIVQIVRETQSRIEGLDKRWKALLDREKEESEKDKMKNDIKKEAEIQSKLE